MDDGSIYVLLPESPRRPRTSSSRASVPSRRASCPSDVRIATFPEDGLTSGAIIAAVNDGAIDAVPIPIRPTTTAIEPGEAAAFAIEDELPVGRGRTVMIRSPGQVRTPPHYAATKRALDLLICLAAAPLLLPIGLLCALLIRLESPGPIMFRQMRTGQHGVRFPMFKFRTMVQNAEELKASLQHLNILPPPDFKIPNDPRITRIGRFLRKTSLDELPQILNVIRGEMTIVGPAPDVVRGEHLRPVALRATRGRAGHHRPVAGQGPRDDDVRRAAAAGHRVHRASLDLLRPEADGPDRPGRLPGVRRLTTAAVAG